MGNLEKKEQKSYGDNSLDMKDNYIIDIINNSKDRGENEEKRRWERKGAISALGDMMGAVGKAISLSSGVKVSPTRSTATDYAVNQIRMSEQRSRNNYQQYYKDLLNESVRVQKRDEKIEDNLLNVQRDSIRHNYNKELLDKRLNNYTERDNNRIDAANNRLDKTLNWKERMSLRDKRADKVLKPKERKVSMYVKNGTGNTVPLYPDDVTKLYRLAKESNKLGDYDNAKNESKRRQEFNVAIQRAYFDYEDRLNENKK